MKVLCQVAMFCSLTVQAALPLQGEWTGVEQCMELNDKPTKKFLSQDVRILVKGIEVLSQVGSDEKRTMISDPSDSVGLSSEKAPFLKSVRDLPVLSKKGKKAVDQLSKALSDGPSHLRTYRLVPGKALTLSTVEKDARNTVVEGVLFCDPSARWCHAQALRKMLIQGETHELRGGETYAKNGNEMVRVSYLFDDVGCAPRTCIYVCEAKLDLVN